MKLVGNLDRKRIGILGVELSNINIVQKPVSGENEGSELIDTVELIQ